MPLMYVRDYEGVNDSIPLSVDPHSKCLPVVNFIHRMTHLGNVFTVSSKLNIASSGVAYLLGKVGATAVHWNSYILAAVTGPIDVKLFEAPTITANGSQLNIRNRNRESSNVSNMTVYGGPTVSAEGTELFNDGVLATASGAVKDAFHELDDAVWVLKPNTDYILRLENLDGINDSDVWARFTWHEYITPVV